MDIEREVQEAIGLLSGKSYGTHNLSCDCAFCKAIDLAITALQAYQPTISKTETTSCEWCEIARVCKYEVTFFEDDNRFGVIRERSLLPKYCPNCGRRLED